MENKNTGFIEQAPRETDFIAGSSSVTPLNHPTGNWFNSLPSDERQSGVYFDSMGCVSYSAINVIETQINWMVQTGKLPDNHLLWLINNGYIKKVR